MHSSRNKQKYEKSALRISITGSTIFVILEIVMAVITRSQAVLLDSVYDGVEILMVFVSLSLVPLMYKPSSESHPFGYQQIESLFVVVKGAITENGKPNCSASLHKWKRWILHRPSP